MCFAVFTLLVRLGVTKLSIATWRFAIPVECPEICKIFLYNLYIIFNLKRQSFFKLEKKSAYQLMISVHSDSYPRWCFVEDWLFVMQFITNIELCMFLFDIILLKILISPGILLLTILCLFSWTYCFVLHLSSLIIRIPI